MSWTPSSNSPLPLSPSYNTNFDSDRTHYRLVHVFYTPYNEIKDMRNVVQSLQSATISKWYLLAKLEVISIPLEALQQMWERFKYVHMDINLVTVRWDSNSKTGKLADFDYAIPKDHKPAHMVKVESTSIEANGTDASLCYRDCLTGAPRVSHSIPPLGYNPIHDLESIMWLGIWSLFYRAASSCDNYPMLQNQASDALRVFRYQGFFGFEETSPLDRFRGEHSMPHMGNISETFSAIRKGLGETFWGCICEARRRLVEADHDFEGIHRTFMTILVDIIGELGSVELPIKSIARALND